MAIVTFAPVTRKGTHVIITAYSESGGGKTYSLIKLGRGLVGPQGKLALLDTESGRGMIYAKLGYDYAELTPPFTPERYIEAIDAAEEAGYDALIIDTGSHEWQGFGGVLDIADSQTSQSGAALQGLVKWAKPKARHKKYVQRLLNSRMHLLLSLRAKEKMIQCGGNIPVPPGMKSGDIYSAGYVPIQDKRFVFETTVQLFMPVYEDRKKMGIPKVEKCPEDLWGAFPDGKHVTEETGRMIAEWISGGTPLDHVFEALKRDAEEAAGGGTEALRIFWRKLNKANRDRLMPHADNLGSIAGSADREEEERQRERQASHQAFRPVGAAEEGPLANGVETKADADDDPFARREVDQETGEIVDRARSTTEHPDGEEQSHPGERSIPQELPAVREATPAATTNPPKERRRDEPKPAAYAWRNEAFWSQEKFLLPGETPKELLYNAEQYLGQCRDKFDVNGIELDNDKHFKEVLSEGDLKEVASMIRQRRKELST